MRPPHSTTIWDEVSRLLGADHRENPGTLVNATLMPSSVFVKVSNSNAILIWRIVSHTRAQTAFLIGGRNVCTADSHD